MVSDSKIAIIGAGSVGASIAYALVLKSIPAQLLLVDIDEKKTLGEVLDLNDSQFYSGATKVKRATFQEAGQADIIVITAGAKQRPGESRDELVGRNYNILNSILTNAAPLNPKTKLLLVANPVDILTTIAQKISGLPKNQVFGSGTYLDSARLRGYLSDVLKISESAIHCYVFGEHGDRQFIGWSAGRVGGVPILEFPEIQQLDREALAKAVARKAYEIIELKGATYYGIAACVSSLCESMLHNTYNVRPVSCWNEQYQVYVSSPAVIGQDGVQKVLDVHLNEEEQGLMIKAVESLKSTLANFN